MASDSTAGNVGWIEIPAPSGVRVIVTTRPESLRGRCECNLAQHVGPQRNVAAHRDSVANLLAVTDIQWLNQVHGNSCVYVKEIQPTPEADAAVTDQSDIALAVLTADCVPIVLASEGGAKIGVVHAGWQGMVGGVIKNAVASFGHDSSPTWAWIGPAICAAHYEVGADVWQLFTASDYEVHPSDDEKRLLNLPKVARSQLFGAGVANVVSSDLCSYEQDVFYSHRRVQRFAKEQRAEEEREEEGRFATVVKRTVAGGLVGGQAISCCS